MEKLPIELLQSICVYLDHQDLIHLCQINKQYSKIPHDDHFWQLKVQHSYPDRVSTKPDDRSWFLYFYNLIYPIVSYYNIFKIDYEAKIKYRDTIRLYPNYTWDLPKPIEIDQMIESLKSEKDVITSAVKSQFENNPMFAPLLQTGLQNVSPQTFSQFDNLFQNLKTSDTPSTTPMLYILECLTGRETQYDEDQIKSIDGPENIYIVTTETYDLIALIQSDRKLLVNPKLYPDARYIFSLIPSMAPYSCLKTALTNLKRDDEIEIAYLSDGIKLFCSDIKHFNFSNVLNEHFTNLLSSISPSSQTLA